VQVYGALRAVFHDGQTGASVSLNSILTGPDVYAVGALADLAGEATVLDGRAYLSYPEGGTTRTETVFQTDAAATLLVVCRVPAWRAITIERRILFDELDVEIARIADSAGVGVDERLPFLLQGEFEDLQWHVVDGSRLTTRGGSHQDHLAVAVKARLDRGAATLVGFFSRKDQGVFTHLGSNTHIHCVIEEPVATGHVDHVIIPAGTIMKIPGRPHRPDQAIQRTDSAGR